MKYNLKDLIIPFLHKEKFMIPAKKKKRTRERKKEKNESSS